MLSSFLLQTLASPQYAREKLTNNSQASRETSYIQIPMIVPESSTSIAAARVIFGSPGMSIMLPAITTTKPAPAESEALVTFRVQPVGTPRHLESSDSENCVFAMQTGFRNPNPRTVAVSLWLDQRN